MTMQTAAINTGTCRWCGMIHYTVCAMVKAIEYHADGVTVKRVEFKGAQDYPQITTDLTTILPFGPAGSAGLGRAARAKQAADDG